jgi:hypothetical protein
MAEIEVIMAALKACRFACDVNDQIRQRASALRKFERCAY